MSMSESLLQLIKGETFDQLYERYEQAIAIDPDNRELILNYADALIEPLIDGIYKYDVETVKQIV